MQDLVDAGSCSQPPSGKDYRGGEAQIAGEARKARRRNDLQKVICQLLPAPSNLPLWLCLASYVEKNITEKILIRAFALYQAFIVCSAFEDFISSVCSCLFSILQLNKYILRRAKPFLRPKVFLITKIRQ